MAFYAKVDKVTGKIFGSGSLLPENASRMPCLENQMMIEVREAVDTKRHFFVDLETHDLLDENGKVPPPFPIAVDSPAVQSPVKHLRSEVKS